LGHRGRVWGDRRPGTLKVGMGIGRQRGRGSQEDLMYRVEYLKGIGKKRKHGGAQQGRGDLRSSTRVPVETLREVKFTSNKKGPSRGRNKDAMSFNFAREKRDPLSDQKGGLHSKLSGGHPWHPQHPTGGENWPDGYDDVLRVLGGLRDVGGG